MSGPAWVRAFARWSPTTGLARRDPAMLEGIRARVSAELDEEISAVLGVELEHRWSYMLDEPAFVVNPMVAVMVESPRVLVRLHPAETWPVFVPFPRAREARRRLRGVVRCCRVAGKRFGRKRFPPDRP